MTDEQGSDGAGGSDPSKAGPEHQAPAGERAVEVGADGVVRPDGTRGEAADGEGSLDERLARKDRTPAGPSDAGIG